jgi:hypothetical protein
MPDDRASQLRVHLTTVLLALEMLYRRERPRVQQARIAQLGLTSARRLAKLLLRERSRGSAQEREMGTT